MLNERVSKIKVEMAFNRYPTLVRFYLLILSIRAEPVILVNKFVNERRFLQIRGGSKLSISVSKHTASKHI